MNGGFASLHPVPCFVYYAGAILFGMLLFHPVYLTTAIVALLVLNVLHDRGKRLRQWLPFYVLTGVTAALLNPLFSHRGRHILFYFMDQPITLEAVLYGATLMLSLMAVLLAFLSYNYVITTEKFMYLFSAAAPKTALLALMSLRFAPLLKRRLRLISLVQSAKGISVREGGLRKRLRDGMLLLRILLVWSLEEALQTADSMKARGYGTGRRSAYNVYRMDRRDWAVLAFIAAAGLICVAGWTQGYGVLRIYPRLEPVAFTRWEGLVYGSFSAFMLTPIVVEGTGRLAWK